MELRDVIGILAGLDDDRREVSASLARSLHDLEGAIEPDDRLGVEPGRVAQVRDGIDVGSDESAALGEIASRVAAGLAASVRADAEQLVAGRLDGGLDAFANHVAPVIERARTAFEALGRIREALARRIEVDARSRVVRKPFLDDAEALELIDVLLAERQHVASDEDRDAASLLAAAESAAASDGRLAGIASNARALREAIAAGRDAARTAEDLARRIVTTVLRTARERDELRRRIAAVSRELERHESLARGLAQATAKASAVILKASRLERLPPADQQRSGALGPLKAACLEHGIISMMLGLQELHVDRADFDRALSDVSSALGTLLALVEDRPGLAERLVPAWDDLAAVDARTMEPEWQAALWDVVGLREDRHGILSVAPERLARLVLADSLEPWRRSLLVKMESKTDDVVRATRRLETLDEALTELGAEGGEIAAAAMAVKGGLARFVGEALHLMGECRERIQERLLRPDTGFALVADRVAPFGHVEDLAPDADEATRQAAVAATLSDVRSLFSRLRSAASTQAGPEGAHARETEQKLREEAAAAHRRLAAVLTRARRLHQLVLPPLPVVVEGAIVLARQVRERAASDGAEDGPAKDRLGEALEALHQEREFHSLVEMPSGSELPALRSLATMRGRRLMDLHGAGLTLLFRLLELLGAEHDDVPEVERLSHFEWIDELLGHAERDVRAYMGVLDECLLELVDNSDRLGRHAAAFDAYHSWARSVAEGELGMELAARHGARFFERFEEPLGRLGTAVLDSIRPDASDWRASSALESVMDLQSGLLARLATRPTQTDLAGRIASLRERAARLRDEVVARAEANDPFARGSGGRIA